jgi:hypothetical protein
LVLDACLIAELMAFFTTSHTLLAHGPMAMFSICLFQFTFFIKVFSDGKGKTISLFLFFFILMQVIYLELNEQCHAA